MHGEEMAVLYEARVGFNYKISVTDTGILFLVNAYRNLRLFRCKNISSGDRTTKIFFANNFFVVKNFYLEFGKTKILLHEIL